ncbi:LuxR C-terminal-related transcriptional regulator [Photobacterium sp. SP02]|uniref:LuxR C-terminal-related transcriptional regulator n=1 Tax=unclassified Photobacterium TaxID=2628852 RepID=UPI00301D566E
MESIEYFLENPIIDFPVGILFVKDKNYKLVACNRAYLELSGKSDFDEVIGKSDDDMPWKVFSRVYRTHDKDIIEGKSYDLFEPIIDATGERFNLYVRKNPILDKSGKIAGIVANAMIFNFFDGSSILKKSSGIVQNVSCGVKLKELTSKEKEVLFLFLNGHKRKFISDSLEISSKTFDTHISFIKEKLGCQSSNEIMIKGIELGLHKKAPESLL